MAPSEFLSEIFGNFDVDNQMLIYVQYETQVDPQIQFLSVR